MTKDRFKFIEAKSWDEAVRHVTHFGAGFVFRGQGNADWTLSTSLERQCQELGHAGADERQVINEFRRHAHHYLEPQHIPEWDDVVEWLALMQHSGAPTRLLDWTFSPYVALFFALESAEHNGSCAVWGVDAHWSYAEAGKRLTAGGAPDNAQYVMGVAPEFFEKYVLANVLTAGVIPLQPRRANERLTIQQGLFLAAGNSTRPFIDNVTDGSNEEVFDKFIKVVIPTRLRAEGLSSLRDMNITSATLYPGLDGFARSLRHRLLKENPPLKGLRLALFGTTPEKATRPTGS